MSLRVAIVHYHLRRGGVTRVIEHATRTLLERSTRVAWIASEPPADPAPEGVATEIVPELAYGRTGTPAGRGDVSRALRAAARRALGAPPDLWHIHNHALGKNLTLPAAVADLAAAGERMLLQLHDFAEDARPANYQLLARWWREGSASVLYPTAPAVHYAVLNRRDYRFLANAGMARERLHVLPNAVAPAAPAGDAGSARSESTGTAGRYYLYPTRAIRRKNLGEFLFWSALAGPGDRFATTLAPQNPLERPRYDRWVAFSRERSLPVDFAVGERGDLSFAAQIRSATALVTTSVQEGFGMAFLEPWLFDRPLVGRDLPEITEDFKRDGVDLSALYDRLEVPLEWIDVEELRARIGSAMREAYARYDRALPEDDVDRAAAAAVTGDGVDLARLDEPLIEAIIERVVRDKGARDAITPRQLGIRGKHDAIARNRRVVEECYSLAGYGDRLAGLYRDILAAEPGACERIASERVLEEFLAPERFRLLGGAASDQPSGD